MWGWLISAFKSAATTVGKTAVSVGKSALKESNVGKAVGAGKGEGGGFSVSKLSGLGGKQAQAQAEQMPGMSIANTGGAQPAAPQQGMQVPNFSRDNLYGY